MKLNVIIPTYNRADLLRKNLCALASAKVPNGLEVSVKIVNNNSTDETENVIEETKKMFQNKSVESLFEARQGRSNALNAGLQRADGDLLTTLDDDICISENWFVEIEKIFRNRWNEIDFVGGKILPEWEDENIPEWIEPLKSGAIGWRDYGDEEWIYTLKTPILSGGHAIFKRKVFDEIGYYAESLGAVGKNLMSCEDDIIFRKLIAARKRGIYAPQLVVYHFVPRYRVSKSYYRQWCFSAGKSWDLMDKNYEIFTGARLFGLPRYLYGEVCRETVKKIGAILKGNESDALASENKILIFAGFFYARHIKNSSLRKPFEKIARSFVKVAER